MNDRSEVKVYKSLSRNSVGEEYAKTLEEMYLDVVSVPMFDDVDTLIDKWGIEWFHQETQDEIAWTVITCMMNFINQTGHELSHVIENEQFKFYAQVQERICTGQEATIFKDNMGVPSIIEQDMEQIDNIEEEFKND